MSFAQITLVGNIGQMPEFKAVGGKQVCNFSVAVNRKVKDEKVTTWYTVICWDDRKNEIVKNYVRKGNQIMIVGQLQPRPYKDKNGDARIALDVDISFGGHLVLLNSSERDDEPKPEPARAKKQQVQEEEMDDSIPF
jgi:hypothetical protein